LYYTTLFKFCLGYSPFFAWILSYNHFKSAYFSDTDSHTQIHKLSLKHTHTHTHTLFLSQTHTLKLKHTKLLSLAFLFWQRSIVPNLSLANLSWSHLSRSESSLLAKCHLTQFTDDNTKIERRVYSGQKWNILCKRKQKISSEEVVGKSVYN